VTSDPDPAAGEQARAAARLRGVTQALHVLGRRSPQEQQRASLFAVNLLRTEAAAADWTEAGLPELPPAEPAANAGQPAQLRLPVNHRAVVLLARAAMDLHAAGQRISERPGLWDRLTAFFADRLPESNPELSELRERASATRAYAGEASRIFDLHHLDGRGGKQARRLITELTPGEAKAPRPSEAGPGSSTAD
jgi:hypothetical protein